MLALFFGLLFLVTVLRGFSTTGKNAMLDALTPDRISLHSGDPGASGTSNEVSGGGYSRQAATFNAASGGSRALNANVDFTTPANQAVTYIGIWRNSGTVFYGSQAVTGDQAANASGEYRVTASGTALTLT